MRTRLLHRELCRSLRLVLRNTDKELSFAGAFYQDLHCSAPLAVLVLYTQTRSQFTHRPGISHSAERLSSRCSQFAASIHICTPKCCRHYHSRMFDAPPCTSSRPPILNSGFSQWPRYRMLTSSIEHEGFEIAHRIYVAWDACRLSNDMFDVQPYVRNSLRRQHHVREQHTIGG
jgi:hypothetical protein